MRSRTVASQRCSDELLQATRHCGSSHRSRATCLAVLHGRVAKVSLHS